MSHVGHEPTIPASEWQDHVANVVRLAYISLCEILQKLLKYSIHFSVLKIKLDYYKGDTK
jgi:hypothetical protein